MMCEWKLYEEREEKLILWYILWRSEVEENYDIIWEKNDSEGNEVLLCNIRTNQLLLQIIMNNQRMVSMRSVIIDVFVKAIKWRYVDQAVFAK